MAWQVGVVRRAAGFEEGRARARRGLDEDEYKAGVADTKASCGAAIWGKVGEQGEAEKIT